MKLSRVAVPLIIVLTLARVAATYSVFSETNDEPMHASSGVQIFEQHEYSYQTANPPLPRLFFGIGPWLNGAHLGTNLPFPAVMEMFYSTGDYPRSLFLARAGNLPFLLITLVAAWAWARREGGDVVGLIALLILANEPALLGHAGVTTHDVAAAAGVAVSLFAFSRWSERPSAGNAAVLGAAFGFSLACKFSDLLFVPAACLAILLVRSRLPRGKEIAWAVPIVAGVAALVLWASYGFMVGDFHGHWVPAPRFFEGLQFLSEINRGGHQGYFHGKVSSRGWWYYFPVALALKTTLGLLALVVAGFFVRRSEIFLQSIAAAGAMLAMAMTSTLDIGVRYVLPVYVPLALAAAMTATEMLRRSRGLRVTAIVILLAQIGAAAVAHPDYLAYFNATAGRDPSRYLIDSNLDWGQDVRRLGNVLRELKVDRLRYDVMTAANLDALAFPPHQPIRPFEQAKGWIAISDHPYRIERANVGGRLWLDKQPYRRVGKSIRLYHIQ